MKPVTLSPEECGLLISILDSGYVLDLHPNYRAAADPALLAALDAERARADRLLARIKAAVGIR